jgi:hypothetical protein
MQKVKTVTKNNKKAGVTQNHKKLGFAFHFMASVSFDLDQRAYIVFLLSFIVVVLVTCPFSLSRACTDY